ncbi:PTS system mannose/fructose/sorbose family IID component [Pseudodesulfovibrio profundus]|uniref:PTS system mannose/fructose/sorbose family IID component n=1 Tax=Pseudodesulfovibrio profundus TaxID=57320 RepID=A0A2C8FAD6_9BACT|nr:PTS system mannose/fructose/sorbose family transporter subunit IID [Pseudodesulfovibrio profundus]SOB59460.1 PTS system mannose/fructose/sorbose family IID component [Pseudodesulfovibrio profundus]
MPPTPKFPPDSQTMAYVRSFIRCYMSGAGFNTRGMQNIGLTYAMQPGLGVIHEKGKDLKEAQKRYVSHYQSHPFWMPCLVGIYLNVESAIAAGRFPPKMFAKVKDTTAYTLSAIGDSVFAGSLLIFWVLLTICLLLMELFGLAFGIGVLFFVGLQAFRAYTFVCGVRQGFKCLERLKRWDLINWGRRIKYVNAAMLVWLWVLIWPHPIVWWKWCIGLGMLMLFAQFVRTGLVGRVVTAAVFVGATDFFPVVEQWLRNML